MLADGTTFEGEAIGAAPPSGVATGEVVFNTVLSGYQEIITDPSYAGPDHHVHLPAHRQLRRERRRRREPPAVLPRRHRPRPRPPPQQLAQRPSDLDDFLRAPRRARHRRHRHPPAHPPHPRRRRDARRVRHRRRGALLKAAAHGRAAAPTASTSSPQVTTADAVHGRPTARAARRRLRLRDQAHDPAPARRAGCHGRGRARVDDRRPRCSPASPTACSCRTAPATRPRSRYARRQRSRRCSARCPVFGICLGHQLLGLALGARDRTSCRSATTAATTRCATWRPGAVEITSQNHNYAVDADSLAGGAEVTHVNLNDGVVEGLRVPRRAARSACSTTPRPGPGPHDAALPVRGVHRADGAGDARCPAATDLESILLIGSGPDRDRPGLRVRLLGHPGVPGAARRGLPRRPRQLEPGDDHDRPRVRRRHLRRAARRRRRSTRIIERERPDALLPTLGGQTALNLAMELARAPACSTRYGVELIGANVEAIRTAEDRERFKAAMNEIGLARAAVGHRLHARRGARRSSSEVGYPVDRPARVHPRRRRHRHRARRRRVRSASPRTASPPARSREILIERVDRRLEGVRARGHARPRRQRAWSSARSRTSTRWACTPATRSRSRRRRRSPTSSTSACATPRSRASAASASRPAARTCSSRSNPDERRAWSSSR